jgi:poly-gamma-glutamate synthesis protein (capsule biosynthesis protein)
VARLVDLSPVSRRFVSILGALGLLLAAGVLVGERADSERASHGHRSPYDPSGRLARAQPVDEVRRDRPRPAMTTTSTTAPPVERFTLVAAGDVLLHSALWSQAQADAAAEGRPGMDFGPMMAGIKPIVSGADLAVCHMETPMAPPGGPYSSYPVFSVPQEIAPALKATGFDACSTSSNHTLDKGTDGIDRTLNALDAVGIRHYGSARNPQEAQATTIVDVKGTKVALLSYAFGFNGFRYPNGETWRANMIDEQRILADAALARRRGAEIVVLSLHWGTEYMHQPNAQQVALAPRLIGSPDIDLILSHHAHVVEPVQNFGGKWVVFGMGNMIANQTQPEREEGLLTRFTFTRTGGRWRVTDAAFEPLLTVHGSPIRLYPVGRTLAGGGVDQGFRQRLVQARDRTTGIVGQLGALQSGFHPITP